MIKFYGEHFARNGATGIAWLKEAKTALLYMPARTFTKYIYAATVYFPITIFASMSVIFILYSLGLCRQQRTFRPLVLGFLVLVSLFGQAILQGEDMPYRTAQTIQLFIGFAGCLLVNGKSLLCLKRKYIVLLLLFLSFRQGIYLHQVLALNNQRSNNETAIIHDIGTRLYRDFDTNKTVIFAYTSPDLGEWINEQVAGDIISFKELFYSGDIVHVHTKYIGTNVNPVLAWASGAFSSQTQMKLLFSYCGYDLKVLDKFSREEAQEYRKIAAEHHMKPFEIRDMGEYILVCLSKIN